MVKHKILLLVMVFMILISAVNAEALLSATIREKTIDQTAIEQNPWNSLTRTNWAYEYTLNGASPTIDSTGGPDGSPAFRATFPAGMRDGVGPGKAEYAGFASNAQENIYYGYWFKFSDNFEWHPVMNKVSFIWNNNQPNELCHDGINFGAIVTAGDKTSQKFIVRCTPAIGEFIAGGNLGHSPTIQTGRWYWVEVHLKMNTVGQANGILEAWIDGTKIMDYTDRIYRSNSNAKWYAFSHSAIHGGNSNIVKTKTDYIWIDQSTLSTGRIGMPGITLSFTPTPSPIPTPTPTPTPNSSPTTSGNPSPSSSDAIIFQDDFESGNLNKWDDIATSRYSVTSDLTKVKSGIRALEGLITPSNGYGSINKWFMPGIDEIYVKYNVMFENGFINRRGDGNGMHFFVVKGNNINNKWSASGKAGIVPSGYDYFYAGIDPEYVFDNTPFPLATYTYYPDMVPPWGNAFKETSPKINLVPGQWHELVFHVKLNTPGQKDGSQELWIDGVKKIEVKNLRWRDTTDVRINHVEFDNYMPGAPKTEHIWVDNIAVWKPGATTITPALTPTPTPTPITTPTSGKIYYVSNKRGSGSGTFADPFGMDDLPRSDTAYCSLQSKALEVLQPGDTLYFRGGLYFFNTCPGAYYYLPYIRTARSGTLRNPISFKSYLGELAEFRVASGGQPPFGAYGQDYIKFERFKSHEPVYLRLTKGSELAYSEITGSYVATSDNHDGLRVEEADSVWVHHNVIHGVKGLSQNSAGIKLYTTKNSIFEDNYIYDNTAGIFDKMSGTNNTIRRNYLTKNTQDQFYGNNQGSLMLDYIYDNVIDGQVNLHSLSDGTEIHDNLIRANQLAGAWATPTSNNKIWNNIVVSKSNSIIAFYESQDANLPSIFNYFDYNIYDAAPKYSLGVYTATPSSFSLQDMQNRGFEINSKLAPASNIFVDEVNYQLHSQWKTAGRFGDAPGPENIALILNTDRYGPSALSSTSPTPTSTPTPPPSASLTPTPTPTPTMTPTPIPTPTSSSNPGTVNDLKVISATSDSVTLSFTEVNDGTGLPAKYDVRYNPRTISWGSSPSTTFGTCSTPVQGTNIGATKTCTVSGLTPNTQYQFQLIAYRGTLNLNAVFGSLSNIVAASTLASTSISTANSTQIATDYTASLQGDINNDGIVNIQDLYMVTSYFGKSSFDSRVDVAAPFGTIDIFDAMVVVRNWGRSG